MKPKKSLVLIVTSMIIASGLYGCSKHESTQPEKQTSSSKPAKDNTTTSTPPQSNNATPSSQQPQANLSTSFGTYQNLGTNQVKWMAMYYATANISPIPYGKFADQMISGYSIESNPFKKQHELKEIIPEVKQIVSASSANRYYYFLVNLNVHNYNMNTSSFKIGGFGSGNYYAQGDYGLTFSNGAKFSQYKVTNKKKAENLESIINKSQYQTVAKVYFYSQNTEYSMPNLPKYTTVAEITRIEIYNRNDMNKPIFVMNDK